MPINNISYNEYKELNDKDPHVLIHIIFGCWICDAQVGNPFFKKKDIKTYVVQSTKDELELLGIDQTPLTKVFINGEEKFSIGGLLYPSQLSKIESILKGK